MNAPGHVYLVGAGPGPVDLLTLRATRLLREAEVLAYDDLVHPSLLELVPHGCELMAIGYRAGEQAHRPPPLHPDVLARALAGKKVVRLKSGDPLIFGRGGEEAESLEAAGIAYSFIPGITAALAAAASCKLPLTWRGRSSELRISTQGTSLAAASKTCTYALYMPRHKVKAFAQELLDEGWPSDTSAAFIVAAAHQQERCLRGRLDQLAAIVEAHPSDLPGIVLVGDSLRHDLKHKELRGSLQGCRILIARAHADASQVQSILMEEGADAWSAPWIGLKPNLSSSPDLATVFERAGFCLIPSASAFRGFRQRMEREGFDIRRLHQHQLLTVGAAREELAQLHLHPLFHVSSRRRLLLDWPHHLLLQREGVILSAGEEGEEIRQQIAAWPYRCELVDCASFEVQYPRLPLPKPDYIIAPHRKALNCLLSEPSYREVLCEVPLVAFGPSVAALARTLGMQSIIQTPIMGIEEVVSLLKSLWTQKERGIYGDGAERPANTLHGTW